MKNMDVSSSAFAAAVQAVRAVVSAYEGYEKGRFMKSDEAVRSEIQRRCEMINRHIEKIQTDLHRAGNRDSRNMLDGLLESINLMRSEAQFSITSNHVSKHAGIGTLDSKSVRKLVKHDGEVLQGLVNITRMANELFNDLSALNQEDLAQRISDWQQSITRVRNMYLERNMYIDGLTKR